jgi:hypothetical protein
MFPLLSRFFNASLILFSLGSRCSYSEFCDVVHKIFIYTREVIQKMNPGALRETSEDNLSASLERGLLADSPEVA